jgi:hypothetical protein
MISSFWAVFSGDFGGADDFRGELVGAGETGGILQERVKKDRKVEIARGFCVFRADFRDFGRFGGVFGRYFVGNTVFGAVLRESASFWGWEGGF